MAIISAINMCSRVEGLGIDLINGNRLLVPTQRNQLVVRKTASIP